MADRSVTKQGKLENYAGDVIAALSTGATWSQVVEQYDVSRQSLAAFVKRHRAEIEELRGKVAMAVEGYAIAHKVNRIAGLQKLHDEVRAVIDERGMIERTITTTEHAEIVRERFARELPSELRAIYRAAAEETGQLEQPKSGDTNIIADKVLIVRGVPELGV